MKKQKLILFFLLISLVSNAQLSEFLKSQPEIKAIEKIQGNNFFTETWEIMVRQALDHTDTTLGFFLQRVFVADKGKNNAVLLITEGYAANYAEKESYINELSPMLNSSQICIEHRYFGKSWPDSLNWDYLTVQNAAADHHKIAELFKKYYSGKWINTGISKGGQTAVYHRAIYPKDVDVTVAYVCPLNFGVEDGRHEVFLRKVPGTPEQRQRIMDFQIEVLKNRNVIIPKLESHSKIKNFTYRIPINEVLDFCVLEYPFSLWQWGQYIDQIPGPNSDINDLYSHLMLISSPSYFAIEEMESIKSFFVQAARELGYYGYDTKPFNQYLSIKTAKNYLPKVFLPYELKIKYHKSTAKQVKKFIKTTDSNILFIYGEFDPWSASGFEVEQKSNLLKVVKSGGSHLTRIANLPPAQKNQVEDKLEEWLEIPVSVK